MDLWLKVGRLEVSSISQGDFMQKVLVVLGVCIALGIHLNAQSPQEAKPSFDCAKAKSKVEKMICEDSSGKLQRLDRLYSKLYFSILKSIPKDTQEGQEVREKLKKFNASLMLDRDGFRCDFVAPFETIKKAGYNMIYTNYCLEQIYLEAIANLAFKMMDSDENRKKWNFEQRVEGFMSWFGGDRYYDDIPTNSLSRYNLFDNFFEDTLEDMIVEFMAYDTAQWDYFRNIQSFSDGANSGEFDDAVKTFKSLYDKLYQAFTKDKKLNKLLGN